MFSCIKYLVMYFGHNIYAITGITQICRGCRRYLLVLMKVSSLLGSSLTLSPNFPPDVHLPKHMTQGSKCGIVVFGARLIRFLGGCIISIYQEMYNNKGINRCCLCLWSIYVKY